jgi:probable phosphoglycerate mutase
VSRIILVRHGETVWHKENRYAGLSDVALTDRGRAQANQLAAWAANAGITAVWSSSLSRAHKTAAPSAKALGLQLHTDERLIELDFGQGEGLTSAEMSVQFPEAFAAFRADPVKNFLPDGEDPARAAERTVSALIEISRSPSKRSLVVAHSTLLRLALCQLLGIPLSRYRTVFPTLDNCSLTEIDLDPGRNASLLHFNAPILPQLPISMENRTE